MDAAAWAVTGGAVLTAVALVAAAPALHRAHLRRQRAGGGGAIAGLSSGLDAVWRPSAEDAHADWESQLELPAPSPSPDDSGRIADGTIVIGIPAAQPLRAVPPSLPRRNGSS